MSQVRSKDTKMVPPSGGSLEIGNMNIIKLLGPWMFVPPSGGSLEIGNGDVPEEECTKCSKFPLRGDP